VLALVDQPNDELSRKVFGDKFGIVPYVCTGSECLTLNKTLTAIDYAWVQIGKESV